MTDNTNDTALALPIAPITIIRWFRGTAENDRTPSSLLNFTRDLARDDAEYLAVLDEFAADARHEDVINRLITGLTGDEQKGVLPFIDLAATYNISAGAVAHAVDLLVRNTPESLPTMLQFADTPEFRVVITVCARDATDDELDSLSARLFAHLNGADDPLAPDAPEAPALSIVDD